LGLQIRFFFFSFLYQIMRHLSHFVFTVLGIIFRHPVTGATVIPILSSGEIVLVRRQDTGEWSLPGGIVDWGEQVSATAKRELREETGLELKKIRRLVGVYSARDRDPRLHSISILIEAEAEGEFQLKNNLEVLDVKAFPPEQLPFGYLAHDHEQQLKDFLEGKTILA
jgi:8-oxo-dGTP diphosphatase